MSQFICHHVEYELITEQVEGLAFLPKGADETVDQGAGNRTNNLSAGETLSFGL